MCWLLPCFGIIYKYLCTGFCVQASTQLIQVNAKEYDYWDCMRRLSLALLETATLYSSLIGSFCIPVSIEFYVLISTWYYLGFSHSNRCTLVSHCYFHLKLPDDVTSSISHMFICCISFQWDVCMYLLANLKN